MDQRRIKENLEKTLVVVRELDSIETLLAYDLRKIGIIFTGAEDRGRAPPSV